MNRIVHPIAGACLALVLLSGCDTNQPPAPVPADVAAVGAGAAAPAAPPGGDVSAPLVPAPGAGAQSDGGDIAGGTAGGDGSALALSPLTEADLRGVTLQGELACSFAAEAGGRPLLLARGDVGDQEGRASFAVKIGDYVEQGLALAPGGYDAMLAGGRFGTKGLTLTVRGVGAPTQRGSESPPRPAELLAQRADGAERVFAGVWTCGP